MSTDEHTGLTRVMDKLMAGEVLSAEECTAAQAAHGWRVLRWEPDLPVTEEDAARLTAYAQEAMLPLGQSACRMAGDELIILVACTTFPAKAHRDTVMWLCAHALTEKCSLNLEQEGTVRIADEIADLTAANAMCETAAQAVELSDWWLEVCPMSAADARTHRTHLQTILKRRQYAALAGYVSRALRTEQELSKICFAFVPLIIEAVWAQHAEVSLSSLTVGLQLREMMRKPKDALLAWIDKLPEVLRSCPAATSQAPIERVIAGIQADCSLPYSQSNLSRSLGLTPAYFCRLFREKTGQHFSTYLTRTRMEKAQKLLTPPVVGTLQEISAQCGYPNKSYFCQVFKKYTGMTPGEFGQQGGEE